MTDLTKLFNKHHKIEQIPKSLSWSDPIHDKRIVFKRNKKQTPDIVQDTLEQAEFYYKRNTES